jgi:FdhD protein
MMKDRVKPTNLRTVSTSVARLGQRTREECEDRLAIEEPLEIRLGGRSISVVMRTPGEDHELAAGFLFTEGILTGRQEVEKIEHCTDPENPSLCNVVDVTPRAPVDLSERGWQRNFVSSSSCGLCGKLTIESVHLHARAVDDGLRVPARVLLSMPEQLRSGQAGFDETGGLHAAGLFDAEGRLLSLREDIGRHNAVDKIIGAALLNDQLPLSGRILMVSGRTSFEIVQKALMARIPFVAAVSAASSLAVELAESSRMGLVGFLRGEGMNAYAGAERIVP